MTTLEKISFCANIVSALLGLLNNLDSVMSFIKLPVLTVNLVLLIVFVTSTLVFLWEQYNKYRQKRIDEAKQLDQRFQELRSHIHQSTEEIWQNLKGHYNSHDKKVNF